jgi:hypothetical protein
VRLSEHFAMYNTLHKAVRQLELQADHCHVNACFVYSLCEQRWLIAAGKEALPTDDTTLTQETFVHNVKLHTPFGGGPRTCPGQQLATTDIKVNNDNKTLSYQTHRCDACAS